MKDRDYVNCVYNNKAWCDNHGKNHRKRSLNKCLQFRSNFICRDRLPIEIVENEVSERIRERDVKKLIKMV